MRRVPEYPAFFGLGEEPGCGVRLFWGRFCVRGDGRETLPAIIRRHWLRPARSAVDAWVALPEIGRFGRGYHAVREKKDWRSVAL